MDELEKLLAGAEEKKTPEAPSAEDKAKAESEAKNKKLQDDTVKLEEQKANLSKAIESETKRLQELRKQRKNSGAESKPEEEELPKIDMNDPSAKAWDRHIQESVNPLQSELEKEKQETFRDALQEFVLDHPELKEPDKLKVLVDTYHRLSYGQISERRIDSVLKFLNKANYAEFGDDFLDKENSERVRQARLASASSDIAISRGATGYRKDSADPAVKLPSGSEDILRKWGMTPQEYAGLKNKYK